MIYTGYFQCLVVFIYIIVKINREKNNSKKSITKQKIRKNQLKIKKSIKELLKITPKSLKYILARSL